EFVMLAGQSRSLNSERAIDMPSNGEIDAAAEAMLRRHARNLNCLTWDRLSPNARLGYLEDARVALEVAERVRKVEGYEKRLTGIALVISNVRSAAKLTWNWSRSFQVFGSHGGDAVAVATMWEGGGRGRDLSNEGVCRAATMR